MNADLALALQLADVADAITLERFRAADLRVDVKTDGTPVTEADRGAEEAIREVLRRQRPAHSVVGEEFGAQHGSEWEWFIDPIDGTKNYVRGVPVWGTLLALRLNGRPVCGVISAPALQRRWLASRDEGAFSRDGERLHVSRVASLEEAHVSCTDIRDFAVERREAGFQALLARCRFVRAFGDFWSHMLVAEGALDVGIEAVVNPWDVAAVQVIVEEAGGRFSDFQGEARIDSGNVITSNGMIHDAVVALMQPD
jgi:histidinol-phosphatase